MCITIFYQKRKKVISSKYAVYCLSKTEYMYRIISYLEVFPISSSTSSTSSSSLYIYIYIYIYLVVVSFFLLLPELNVKVVSLSHMLSLSLFTTMLLFLALLTSFVVLFLFFSCLQIMMIHCRINACAGMRQLRYHTYARCTKSGIVVFRVMLLFA